MSNQRSQKRIHLIYYLRVFNTENDQLLGHLVDITTEGLMLISESPIKKDIDFNLRMVLPETIEGSKIIHFQAKSIWCKKDINPDFYDTGFQFTKVSSEQIEIIERLIKEFLFKY
ncbi:PilZ domain-containing protein [Candidatus Magnetomoraceae bacterium gMMP-15]